MATKSIAQHNDMIFNFHSIVFLLQYSLLHPAEAQPIHIPIPPHFGDWRRTLHTNIIPMIIINATKTVLILDNKQKIKSFHNKLSLRIYK